MTSDRPGSQPPTSRPLILGSTSRYRHELLSRLKLPFEAVAPQVDETPRSGENPADLAVRLALAKARDVASRHPQAVVIGSDHAETSLAEVLHLRTLHLFDNRVLLKMWCEATPAAIFPNRRIGKFAEGYEASFLALAGNPIEDFDQVRAIRRRFKEGVPLDGALMKNAAWSAAEQRSR